MNHDSSCPIWDTPAVHSSILGQLSTSINSPRVGGKYVVDDKDMGIFSELKDHDKVKLTSWLVEQRRFGNLYPKITEKVISEAQQRQML